MADVKNVITLGIGAAPGGLVWFITGGLEAGSAVAVVTPTVMMTVPYASYTMTVPYESRTMTVPYEDHTITVPALGGEA